MSRTVSFSLARPLAWFATSVAFAGFASLGGCGDSGSTGEECIGGVVVDGVCEGKCTPDKCLEGNVCVGNRCKLECTSHNQCYAPFRGDSTLQGCVADKTDTENGLKDGDTVYVCTDLEIALKIGSPCPLGNECGSTFACPDGSPCAEGEGSDVCSAAECRPLVCRTRGEGDAEAYCTTTDCTEDAQCGPGMYCSPVRVPNRICGTDKGQTDPCIDPANFNADGATYQEGPLTLMRNVCLKREPCAPCNGPTDCSLSPDMSCVNLSGSGKVCAESCNDDDDCPDDFKCASNFCVPRTGSCAPPAENNFCYSCLHDLQCGDASTSVGCEEVSGGQKACFDFSFPDTCTTDADCPESPSGKHGECLDEEEGVAPGSSVYHRCYYPFYPASSSFQCWPG